MSHPNVQEPVSSPSAPHRAGRNYLSDLAEAAITIVVMNDADGAEDQRTQAEAQLLALATYTAPELHAFIAGINEAAKEYLQQADFQRPSLVLIGDQYALHIPK